MTIRKLQLTLACVLAAALTACGGSGGGSTLPSTPLTTPTPSSGGGSGAPQATNISFVIAIPAAPVSPAVRKAGVRAMDFTAATQSVKIAIGTNVLATANVSSTSSQCKAAASGRTCTIGVTAPTGNDQFTVTAYDQPNGAGNAIAQGTVAATVSSQASTVNVAVAGTIVKISLSLSNPYPPVGTQATANVVVTGYDVDGNAVLGAYPSTVTLADNDPSGATSLSATSVTSSSSAVTLNYNGATGFISATVTATLAGANSASATFAPLPAFLKTYSAPTVSMGRGTGYPGLWNITKGPDGNMWVLATGYSEMIKVAPDGTMTQYTLPSGPGDQTMGLCVGADGNLWFAESNNNAIAKMTTSGVVTEYTLPQAAGYAAPNTVTRGSDGNVWFYDPANSVIGSITPAGTITEYPVPSGTSILAMTSGPDGNLWMVDNLNNAILKVSTSGSILQTYPLSANSDPFALAWGPDGNLWITEFAVNKIARMTPTGTVTEFAVPSGVASPIAIAAGPDGRMWFAEMGPPAGFGKIGYITTDGTQIRDFFGDGMHVHDIAFDANGTLWYVALRQMTGFMPQEVGTFAI